MNCLINFIKPCIAIITCCFLLFACDKDTKTKVATSKIIYETTFDTTSSGWVPFSAILKLHNSGYSDKHSIKLSPSGSIKDVAYGVAGNFQINDKQSDSIDISIWILTESYSTVRMVTNLEYNDSYIVPMSDEIALTISEETKTVPNTWHEISISTSIPPSSQRIRVSITCLSGSEYMLIDDVSMMYK